MNVLSDLMKFAKTIEDDWDWGDTFDMLAHWTKSKTKHVYIVDDKGQIIPLKNAQFFDWEKWTEEERKEVMNASPELRSRIVRMIEIRYLER